MSRPSLFIALIVPWSLAAAQDGAAPSRVQRDADNPLRLIIEAGKLKPRKANEPERPVTPARPPERVQVRARTVADAAVPEAAPVAEPAVAPAMPRSPGVATVVLPDTPAEAKPATLPPPAAPAEPDVPEAAPRAALVAEPAVEVPLAPLRVAQMVDPVLPRRVADKVRGEVEVVVAFTVRADGSVQDPVVQSSTNPAVNPTVLQAVAQWRYGPIAAPRAHAVQLTLRGEN